MWRHPRRVRRDGLGKIEKLSLTIKETTPHEDAGLPKRKTLI